MIGSLNKDIREATVVGAGIAGLLAADALDRAGYRVTLLEASARAGGLIRSTQVELGLVEAAAHSVQATPELRALCERLGVELVPVRRAARARFVWRKGQLRRMPLSIGEIFRAILRAYFVLADGHEAPDRQTLADWGRRHLGEAALKYLLVPFVRGIYGARAEEITVSAA